MYKLDTIIRLNYHIICDVCDEDLGIQRRNWGTEHLRKSPTHRSYSEVKVDQQT
jgi:hypothetical protein